MFDYKDQVHKFIGENFKPSTPDEANFRVSTNQLLGYLFQTFPADCISDYELNDILLSLKYERFTYTNKTIRFSKPKAENEPPKEIVEYHLCVGWCLHTDLIPKLETTE